MPRLLLQLRKTLMQFWKDDNISGCIKNLAWAWADVTKECVNGIWEKTLRRFGHDFKGFAKDEEVAKISKAVDETANNLTLGVDGMTLRSSERGFLRN